MNVEAVAVLPDTHSGFGAPIGSVVVTRERVYPGPVGFDIGCGMNVLTTNLYAMQVKPHPLRRAIMDAIIQRISLGEGKGAAHGLSVDPIDVINYGAPAIVGKVIPKSWVERCEQPVFHVPQGEIHQKDIPGPAHRGFSQLGTLGGGNHFIELQRVEINPAYADLAARWGLFEGQLVIMAHSGSRGFGHGLASWAFHAFKERNDAFQEPYLDKELVHAPVDSEVGKKYLRFVAAGANYALCNRLIMTRLIQDALDTALGGAVTSNLLYEISHNLSQWEDGRLIHRKGTTRALPGGHPILERTPWAETGHPVITPGSMGSYSAIQVGLPGAKDSFFSINHGAGRRLARKQAIRTLDQAAWDQELKDKDILSNHRQAPLDESRMVYKDLDEVLAAVQTFGLADVVARCYPIASIKG